MKPEELEKLNLRKARQKRDALVLDILDWPLHEELFEDYEDDDWMSGNPETFLHELCQCGKGWLDKWREYETEFAKMAPDYIPEWLDLRQLIERVNELEIAEVEKRRIAV